MPVTRIIQSSDVCQNNVHEWWMVKIILFALHLKMCKIVFENFGHLLSKQSIDKNTPPLREYTAFFPRDCLFFQSNLWKWHFKPKSVSENFLEWEHGILASYELILEARTYSLVHYWSLMVHKLVIQRQLSEALSCRKTTM